MKEVKIYTTSGCPFCTAAIDLLEHKSVSFEEINLTSKPQELADLKNRTGLRTVPQVFIGEDLIGGYTELANLERAGQLDQRLS